jgi:8-oxo-dGTP pyrophosphatase MutT (NUDIX family)
MANINGELKLCANCGKNVLHNYKSCNEPITSWGIIAVKNSKENLFIDKYINIDNYYNSLKFLMVSRKHSLGYVEFIRGRYNPKQINGIIYMFKQMTDMEIKNINDKNFDELWEEFWNDFDKKNTNNIEYIDSKTKFNQLKNFINVELSLKFYTENIKAKFKNPEWGFPKGRKIKGETDVECAIREFCEETNLEKTDINILNINPIVENLIGTNGIKYRHIYFLSEIKTDKNIFNTFKYSKNTEIGDINLFTYEEAINLIRDYHVEKKNIVTNIFMNYLNNPSFF